MAGMIRSSVIIASGTMVSRVLGLVKALLLAYAIGIKASGDAFGVGNQLPNTVYTILLGGMVTAVLVPQIVTHARGADGGAGYINKLVTLAIVALTGVTLLATLAAPVLVFVYAADWTGDQAALATAFAYFCLPQIFFYGLYAVVGEVLNARERFGPATWAPVANNVVAIGGLLAFIWLFGADPNGERLAGEWTPDAIAVLAGSATLGVAVQSLLLFLAWRGAGLRFRPDFRWRGMGLRRTAQIAGWSLASVVVTQLGGIATSNVAASASGVGPSISAAGIAWLTFMLPHSIIAISIATASFTRITEAVKSDAMDRYREQLSLAVRAILIAMVLAAVLLVVNAGHVSRVLLAGASEGDSDLFWLPILLIGYAIGLPLFSVVAMLVRGFYALDDTRTPFVLTLLQAVLVTAGTLGSLAMPAEWRTIGIAVSYSIATAIQAVLAMVILRRRTGAFDPREMGMAMLRSTAASVPAVALGLGALWLTRDVWPPGALGALGGALVVSAIMTVVYLGVLRLFRSPEIGMLASALGGRFRRRG